MSSNWLQIRQTHYDYNLPAPDETGPARILELLTQLGLSGVEKEGLVHLVEPVPAKPGGVVFVSLTELLGTAAEAKAASEVERWRARGTSKAWQDVAVETFRLKIGMWLDKSEDWCGPHAYLYLVDLDDWLKVPGNQEVAFNLLHETRGVRKIVCRPDELKARLANAFGEPRASETLPLFEVQRMDPHCFEPAPRDFVTTVTHPFVRVADTQVWIDRLVNHPERARITARTNTLVHRVMGAEYGLWEGSWDVSIERHGRRSDIAWFMLGMGEQYGLSFCIYLAFAFEDSLTQPASSIWLGMTDALNYLDLSHYLLAMDVLRDFVVATGANAYVKTNKDDYQRLAKGKLERAVALREAMMAAPA